MPIELTEGAILEAISHWSEEDGGRAGETPLDRVVRTITFDRGQRERVEQVLLRVIGQLDSVLQWRGLDVLVSQIGLRDAGVGEAIDELVSQDRVGELGSGIWAIRSAMSLGAVPSPLSLERASAPLVRKQWPAEWFALIAETLEVESVERQFERAGHDMSLSTSDALAMGKLFLRHASKLGREWNASISLFLDGLDAGVAQAVAAKLSPVIGPTYETRARNRGEVSAPRQFTLSNLMRGIEALAEKTDWAKYHAQAQLVAA